MHGVALACAIQGAALHLRLRKPREFVRRPTVFLLPARVYSKELIEILFRQPYTKVQILVDSGIAERKTAAVYLREVEKSGILRGKKVGKEVLFLNVKLFQLLSK